VKPVDKIDDAYNSMKIAGGIDDVVDIGKAAERIDDAHDFGKIASRIDDTYDGVNKISPSDLIATHKPTLSKREYSLLLDDIQRNGITEPIKYIEHNGARYVVDGHHRLRIAKELKLDSVPIQKVELPYKGYKSVSDLLWFE
ncbi:MAG: hypothetical protein E7473_09955, partial [Ruminococcaceae bacterium]|nr:hypothetical protein [Oscillospiraceae bacterium]